MRTNPMTHLDDPVASKRRFLIERSRRAPCWMAARLTGNGSARGRPITQTTAADRGSLMKDAAGKRSRVEIGVMSRCQRPLLRSVMDPSGTTTGIDPHPPSRLGMSFERWLALRVVASYPRGLVVLLRRWRHDAVISWYPIDFLFVDGDHSRAGIDRDWRGWSRHVVPGGALALHDSRSVSGRPDLDSRR